RLAEIGEDFVRPILDQPLRDVRVLLGELDHGGIRRKPIRRRAWSCRLIPLAELMNPYKVKGVYELPTARVRPVVGVGEKPAVVDHQPARRAPRHIGIPVFTRRSIYVGQEGLDSLVNIIRAAEGADDA